MIFFPLIFHYKMLYIINGKIAQHNFLKFPQDINICDGGLMFFIVFQWMILSKNLYLKGKINSLKPVDTKKWQVVTPVYFSGGLAAALLHAEVGGTGGLACVVVAHVNMHTAPPPPPFLPLKFDHIKVFQQAAGCCCPIR